MPRQRAQIRDPAALRGYHPQSTDKFARSAAKLGGKEDFIEQGENTHEAVEPNDDEDELGVVRFPTSCSPQVQAEFEKQQAMLAKELRFIERFKAQPSKASQVQSRAKKVDRIEKNYDRGIITARERYNQLLDEFGDDKFLAGMGGEAVLDLLKRIDVHKLAEDLRGEMREATSEAKRKKIAKRLKVIEAFLESSQRFVSGRVTLETAIAPRITITSPTMLR